MFKNVGLFLFFSNLAFGVAGLQRFVSVSHSYDARNIFVNPAALGFETELNGFSVLSSFSYGATPQLSDQFGASVSLGYLGYGMEWLSDPQGTFRNYHFGIGVPLFPTFYAGMKYRFTRSDFPPLDHLDSFDFGFQYRAFPHLSVGFLINGVNLPVLQYVLGLTARPFPRAEICADVDTLSAPFAKAFGYQVLAKYEVTRGLKLRAGYHDKFRAQVGLELNFDRASLSSVYQPDSAARESVVSGIDFSPLPYRSLFRPRSALKVVIDSDLGEESVKGGIFSKDEPSILEILSRLNQVVNDESVVAVLIKLEKFPLGLANAEELHLALLRLRGKGKSVEVFLGNAGIGEYLVASAANRIHMAPSGELRLTGLRSERYYVKGTLDKIGIEGQFLAKGEYKSAPEMFTRREGSPLNKEVVLEDLRKAEDQIISYLSRAGRISREKWTKVLEHALFSAEDAKSQGFVDSIAHFSDEMEKKKRAYLVKESLRARREDLALPPQIAVVVAHGDILQKRVQGLSLLGFPQVTPQKMQNLLKQAVSDQRTKAIVVRVSSRGGEILASDEIASFVENAKGKKPLVVSMGDMAASGGYYIAASGERIFASPLTFTGSIGVFVGKFNLEGLYKKLDLNKEILAHSPYPGLFSEDRPWNQREREIFLRRLNQYYDSFVASVGKARRLTQEQVEKVAKGRVWLGSDAYRLQLVDAEGGYLDAIKFVADKAGLKEEEYETWMVEEERGLLGFFGDVAYSKSSFNALTLGLLSPELARELNWMSRSVDEPYLYLAPWAAPK